jgi:hypothetical protein
MRIGKSDHVDRVWLQGVVGLAEVQVDKEEGLQLMWGISAQWQAGVLAFQLFSGFLSPLTL